MGEPGPAGTKRAAPVGLALAALLLALAVAGWPDRARPAPDEWTAWIETAERSGSGAPAGGPAPAPRVAYLLAFHHAQDESDPEHVLAVADRLEAIGEAELARHVRSAAASLYRELGLAWPAHWPGPPAP